MKTRIDLKHIVVSMLAEGIIHLHIKEGCLLDLNDAVLTVEAMGKIGGGKKYPVLIDAGEFTGVDKDVRIFAAGEESNLYTLADAIAFCNLGQKLIADFYVNHNNPVVPTRVFADKQEAIAWLSMFLRTDINHVPA
jgi:hypothetical protein